MKIHKISRPPNHNTIDIKRMYLPYELEDVCPNGHVTSRNLNVDDYLSYPKLDDPFPVYFYCQLCEEEWYRNVVLNISLTEAK